MLDVSGCILLKDGFIFTKFTKFDSIIDVNQNNILLKDCCQPLKVLVIKGKRERGTLSNFFNTWFDFLLNNIIVIVIICLFTCWSSCLYINEYLSKKNSQWLIWHVKCNPNVVDGLLCLYISFCFHSRVKFSITSGIQSHQINIFHSKTGLSRCQFSHVYYTYLNTFIFAWMFNAR